MSGIGPVICEISFEVLIILFRRKNTPNFLDGKTKNVISYPIADAYAIVRKSSISKSIVRGPVFESCRQPNIETPNKKRQSDKACMLSFIKLMAYYVL